MKNNKLNQFLKINNTFCQLFYGEITPKKMTKELKFDTYLTDNREIEDTILKMTRSNSTNFISAPTGAGKTFLISKIFDNLNKLEINEDPSEEAMEKVMKNLGLTKLQEKALKAEFIKNQPKYINIMATSARSQTLQIGKEYKNMIAIVGNSKDKNFKVDIDLKKNNNFIMVYDMAQVMIDYLNSDPNLIPRLFIDESHNLSQADYRVNAIRKLDELTALTLQHGGSVSYVTASYESMAYLRQIDNILFCEKNVDKKAFEKVELYTVNGDVTIDQALASLLEGKKALVRYNNIKSQDKLVQNLRCQGRNVQFINSNEKEYHFDENHNVVYNNEMMDAIINHSNLPTGVDVAFATSLLDCGTNIKLADNYMDSIFVVGKPNHLNLANIEQFSNRIRTPYHTFKMLCKEPKPEDVRNIIPLASIMRMKKKEKEIVIASLRKTLEAIDEVIETQKQAEITLYGSCDEEKYEKLKRTQMKNYMGFTSYDGLISNDMGGSIIYNEETNDFDFDEKFFLNYCFYTYYYQFNNNIDALKKEIEKMFQVEVKVIPYTDKKDLQDVNEVNIIKTKSNLLNMIEDETKLEEIEEGNITYDRSTEVLLQDARQLNKLGMSMKDAINTICLCDDKEIREKNIDLLKNTLKNKLITTDYELIRKIYEKEMDYIDVSKNREKEILDVIHSNDYLHARLKKAVKIGIDVKEFLEVFINSTQEKELKQYIKKHMIITNNKNYFINEQLLSSKACQEQLYLIKSLDLTKEHTYSKEFIEDYTNKFNKKFKKAYKPLTMRHYIEMVTISDTDRNGNIQVRGLRMAI